MKQVISLSDMAWLIQAVEFASRKQSTQRRKDADASPYINHPIGLASVLAVETGVSDLMPPRPRDMDCGLMLRRYRLGTS